ncbi:MAG: bifunctional transcriptional activator/DNA repair enzyme AdaA [Asticcacaulis sp.]
MLFTLPDAETLYAALMARDDRFDGQAYVGVSSTGVFCRLTCPARKPRFENCSFFPTIEACLNAGFRACRRCHPIEAAAKSDPIVLSLLALLEASPGERWSEPRIAALGYDLSTVRRAFKRHYGMTFLELARMYRLREGFSVLAAGGAVLEAQLEASFESASAFRVAFARLVGCSPNDLKSEGMLRATWIPTPLGDMIAVSSPSHLHLLEFLDRKLLPTELRHLQADAKDKIGLGDFPPSQQIRAELEDYFAARSGQFLTPVKPRGSPFSHEVWAALREIPPGETRSYADIAQAIGRPQAVRAVARANGANPIALVIPCHRVIGSDGSLTGYGGGLWRKQRLIEIERQLKINPIP